MIMVHLKNLLLFHHTRTTMILSKQQADVISFIFPFLIFSKFEFLTCFRNKQEEDDDEYDPFNTAPAADKDRLTEEVVKQIDCHLLGVTESNMFHFPQDEEEAPAQLQSVQALDSMGEL